FSRPSNFEGLRYEFYFLLQIGKRNLNIDHRTLHRYCLHQLIPLLQPPWRSSYLLQIALRLYPTLQFLSRVEECSNSHCQKPSVSHCWIHPSIKMITSEY